jgi:pyruvate/2-oxoglutarate dehydrogenase complex dihydrolipoamide dehydrogenase (E3) component
MEFAQVFNRLGSKVTVIEKFDQILPKEDKELSDELEKILVEEGIEIHTCTEVINVKREGNMKLLMARCSMGDEVISSREVMIAIGRSPNVEGLSLEAAGVKYDKRRGIPVDLTMRTNVKHIYACGDVAGPFPFTHMAEYQAGIVLANALFPLVRRKADYRVVPWVGARKGGANRARSERKIRKDQRQGLPFQVQRGGPGRYRGRGSRHDKARLR